MVVSDGREIGADALALPDAPSADELLAAPGLADAVAEQGESSSSLHRVEREMVQRALKETGANVSKAARMLGVSRDTLRYRIRKHGLVH